MQHSSNINPFLSRRTYIDVCEWWQRSTYDGQISLSKMAHTIAPTGSFHAKAVSNYVFNRKNEGDIRLSNNYVTIETPDNVSNLRPDDLVKFQGIFYRVDNIAKREVAKTREHMKSPISVYILQLTR